MARRSLPLFHSTVLALFAGYLGLRYLLPWLAVWLGLSANPAPVPRFAMVMYVVCAVTGALVYVASDRDRWRSFLGPVLRLLLLEPGPGRAGRLALLVAIPLAAGALAWRRAAPDSRPPAVLRVQHPTQPESYANLANPVRGLPEGERQAAERDGVVLYQKNCRPCHGTTGDGEGPLARGLRLRPVDFGDPGTIATVVESYAYWRAREGAPGLPAIASPWNSAMPGWKDGLSDVQIWQAVMTAYRLGKVEPRKPEAR